MNGQLLLMLLGRQLGRFLCVCHQEIRRKIKTLGDGMRKCRIVRGKRLAKKNWDNQRNEENRQEYKDMCHKVKRVVAKAKGKAFDDLYEKLDTKEGEKGLVPIDQTERPSWQRCATG